MVQKYYIEIKLRIYRGKNLEEKSYETIEGVAGTCGVGTRQGEGEMIQGKPHKYLL